MVHIIVVTIGLSLGRGYTDPIIPYDALSRYDFIQFK